jgi:protocatechuate 3,4-dioxygenase beta subunit
MRHSTPRPTRAGLLHPGMFAAALGLACALQLPSPLLGQDPAAPPALVLRGVVVEQGSERPVPDAVVTLYRQAGADAGGTGAEFAPLRTAVSGVDGAFSFELLEPGTYRLAAEYGGLSSSRSPPVEVQAGATAGRVTLLLPSPLLMLAATCDPDEQPGAVVVGSVLDQSSGVPLPGARVDARWTDPVLGEREQIATTNGSGRYRICGVAAPAQLRLRAEMLGRSGGWSAIEIPRTAIVLHDLGFSLAESVTEDEAEVELTALSSSLGDLTGVLVDRTSGLPIANAVVQIRGTGFQGVTDPEGRFAFLDLLPGSYVLEARHLGFVLEASRVEVPEGKSVNLTLEATSQALELEGIEVVARAAAEQVIRTSPFRRYVVSGADLAREEERGARVTDVLNARMTGLRVREHNSQGGHALCIETVRRMQRMQTLDTVPDNLFSTRDFGGAQCDMVQVILDGIRLGDGDGVQASHYLRAMMIAEVESLEYLPPTHGTLLYGMGGNVSNGVLVIYTRGRGPYRSASRDLVPVGEDR